MTNFPDDDAISRRPPLTLLQKLLYASGHFGFSVLGFGLVASVRTFYFPGEKALAGGAAILIASRSLVGLALSLGRLTDAVNDPLIGYFSDRLRSRFGRRKPFIVGSIIPFIVLYLLVWFPPFGTDSGLNFAYLVSVLVLLYIAYTAYCGPYLALLPEIAGTEQERVSLASLQGLFNVLGILVGAAGGAVLIPMIGYPGTGIALAGIAFVSFWLPVFGPGERSRQATASAFGFREALLLTLRNKPFLVYVIGFLGFWTGLLILVANLDDIGQSLLGLKAGEGLYLVALPLLTGMACLPLAAKLATARGTKWAMVVSMGAFSVVMLLMVTVGMFGDERTALVQMAVLCVLAGPGVAGLFALPYALLASITDADERACGERREAMFFGVQGMVLKAGWGLAPLVGGVLMDNLGGTAAHPLGLHLTGPVAAAFALVGLLVLRTFPEAPPVDPDTEEHVAM